ncbi:MFS transporter [Pseudoalteromonas sp. JBTF-M23]|uniref:MFS transporter n=1 Tax=Pseudoalteromonas caenipelagi TaxID=2726988 RepID=A0A849VBA7_9GAMM|nr:MFS transporter [Pseudoalteromonas caenipelagi]NOU50652.1 MFS transporter [Pseudoalteromonas caenipelagi]
MAKLTKEEIYQRLSNIEDARACEAIGDDACKQVPGNFIFMLISQVFSKFSDALLNPKVTLPWLMQGLGVSSAFIAWLVPIRESGSLLPQLAIASYIRTLPVRKWVWVVGALIQALCIAAMVIIALTLTGSQAGWALIGVLSVFSLARGFNSIAAKDVLGKVIPKSQRGNISGLAASMSGLATLLFALILVIMPENIQYQAVLIALVLGFTMWLFAAGFYSQIIEYKGATDGGKSGLKLALSKLKLLYQDRAFGHFVLTRALLLCSALSAPFYIVLASQQELNLPLLAIFMAVSGGASLISAPIWGRLSDLSSKYVLMVSAVLVTINGLVVYLVAQHDNALLKSIWFLPCMYFLLSVAHQGVRLGRKTYLVNLAQGNQRTDYVSVSNTVIGILLLLLGSIGFLDSWLSVSGLIMTYSLLGLVGAVSAAFLAEVE